MFKDFDKEKTQRKGFLDDLNKRWVNSGAKALYDATLPKDRQWATHINGNYGKLNFMCVALTKKADILDYLQVKESIRELWFYIRRNNRCRI